MALGGRSFRVSRCGGLLPGQPFATFSHWWPQICTGENSGPFLTGKVLRSWSSGRMTYGGFSYICNNLIFVIEWSVAVENKSNVYYHYSPEYPLHVCLAPSVCLRFTRLRRGNLKIPQRAGWSYHIIPSHCHTTTWTGGFFSTSLSIAIQHTRGKPMRNITVCIQQPTGYEIDQKREPQNPQNHWMEKF